jgi:hypothetical protein
MMKIELKRKVDNKWHYIPIEDVAGIPMQDILLREMDNNEACIRVETERGVTIITNNMVHHIHYTNRGYRIMSLQDGIPMLIRWLGDKATVVPEYVTEVFPGAVYVGINDETREVA